MQISHVLLQSYIFFVVYYLHPVAQTRRRVSQSLCLLFNKLGNIFGGSRAEDFHQDRWWWTRLEKSASERQLMVISLETKCRGGTAAEDGAARHEEKRREGGHAWVGVTEEDVRDKVRRRRVIPKGSCWKKKKEISGHSFHEINISSRSCSSCLQFLIFKKQVSISSSLMAGSYLSNMSWSD